MKTTRKSWLAVMLAAAAAAPLHAGDVPVKYVNAHSFLVQVKPAEAKDRDAVAADLFISRFPESGWLEEGPCEIKLDHNEKVFARAVKVPGDGTYYFTSRGVDHVGHAPAPLKGEPAQVRVVADTRPPKVEIFAPAPHTILQEGDEMRLEWTAADEYLRHHCVDLFWSPDGVSWKVIAARQPNTGHYLWTVPAPVERDRAGNGKIFFRVTASDEAGNVGEAVSPEGFKVTPMPQVLVDATVDRPARPVDVPPPTAVVDPYLDKDPRPPTKHPELDANDGEIPARPINEGKTAYIAYVMGGNLVRQGRLKDSLRYFRSAVDIDPNFDEAWNDMALVYRQLGAFTKADACIVKALKIEPENPRYLNTRGLIYQSAGMDILRDPASGDEALARANDLVLFAVKTYGAAVDNALRQGSLAERAETYFHLGEICYFANQDPTGARQYWLKVLDLHTPTPALDEVMLDQGTAQEKLTRSIYEKNTELWVNLQTWQRWAREHIRQLNELERGAATPRAPFTGAQFAPPGVIALGAGTGPAAAGAESFTLLPDGSYAAVSPNGAQPGYVMMPQGATPAQPAAPQVQVINNYITPEGAVSGDALVNQRAKGINNVTINKNSGNVTINAGDVDRAQFPCPLCGIPGCRLTTHQPAIDSALQQRAQSAAGAAAQGQTRTATHYYIEDESRYHEVMHKESWGGRPTPPQAPGNYLNSPYARGASPAPAASSQPPVVPGNRGRGRWLSNDYGNSLGYTYETPRARSF